MLVKYSPGDPDTEQIRVNWGDNDDPSELLDVGQIYEVDKKEVHKWHTKLKLVGVNAWFNKEHFEEIETCQS